jgi:hypothetical protein
VAVVGNRITVVSQREMKECWTRMDLSVYLLSAAYTGPGDVAAPYI